MKRYALQFVILLVCVATLVLLISELGINPFEEKKREIDWANIPLREGQDPDGPIDTSRETVPGGSHVNRDPIDADERAVVDTREKNSLPVDLVADDFQIAAVVQVQQLFKSPLLESILETIGVSLEEIEGEIGLPLGQVERMIVLGDSLAMFTGSRSDTPPLPAIDEATGDPAGDEIEEEFLAQEPVFKFAVIVQLLNDASLAEISTALADRIPGDWQEQQLEGKTCLVSKAGIGAGVPDCICQLDDKTLVIARQDTLLEMIAAEGSGLLASALSTVSLDNDLIVTATPGILPEGIMDGLKESLLPQLSALASLPDNLNSATLSLRVSSEPQLQLDLNAKSRATAATAQLAISSIKSLVELMVPALKEQFSMDPTTDPVVLKSLDFAEQLIKEIKVVRRGLVTTVSVALPEEALAAGIGLLQDSLGAARSSAMNAANMNNLKQTGLGILNYHFTYEKYPVGEDQRIQFKDGKPLLSWRVHILPFLDEEELYNQFHLDEPWDSEHNMTLLEKMPFPYQDNSHDFAHAGMTNFLAPLSEGSILGGTEKVTPADVVDGLSDTVLVLLAPADKAVPWTRPADLEIDPDDPIGSLVDVGDSIVVLFADGSVRPIQLPIEPQQLLDLFNRKDGNAATPAVSP